MSYYLRQPISTKCYSKLSTLVLLTVLLFSPVVWVAAVAADPSPAPAAAQPANLIIKEIKSGGSNTTPNEYVTVYNQSDQSVSLTGWTIEYAKAAFPTSGCTSSDWKSVSSSNVTTASMNGTLATGETSQPFTLAINNDAAGAVHLVDASRQTVDLVGWGSDSSPAPCKEQSQAAMLNTSKSLLRYLTCDLLKPLDSDNNSSDFMIVTASTAGTAVSQAAPACTPPPSTDPEVPNPTTSGCPGITISELLPNPAGTDTGHEFIELHNTSNQPVELTGCSLQTSATSKLFVLDGISLQPDQYYSVADSQSGLSLPNSSGGTVWLLDATNELQATTYPAGMEDDTVWAYVDGQWSVSYSATPNLANILQPTKPCPEGQTRNTETNRCVDIDSIIAPAASAACAAGQERNPETNRCRNITSATSSTVACKEGQERNPETNRCRNITTATTDKACPAGQERNPETNRCRKIVAAGSGQNGSGLDTVKDMASNSVQKHKPYWLIAGGILLAAVAYAIYEWRQEIAAVCARRSTLLSKLQSAR